MRSTPLLLAALLVFPLTATAEDAARASTKDAESLVHKAVAYVAKVGPEKAIAAFNDPAGPFTYLDLYVLAMDREGKILAHGRNQKLVGRNDTNTKDATGNYPFARRMKEIGNDPGKGWLEYKFENPQTKKVETKVAYIERTGDMIIICGAYKPDGK
jgi:signal transduction histidine kinase